MVAVSLLLWFGFVVVSTYPSIRWQIDYFDRLGPRAPWVLLSVVGLVCLGSALYAFAWNRTSIRLELLLPALSAALAVLYAPRAFMGAALTGWGAYAVGRLVMRLARTPRPRSAADIALAAFLGWGLAGFVLFWADLCGLLRWPVTLGLLLVPTFLLLALPEENSDQSRTGGEPEPRTPITGLVAPFSAVLGLSALAVALAPPIAYDSINFHLPLIEQRAVTGHAPPSEVLQYSYYPQSFETLSAWAVSLGGEQSSQILVVLITGLCLTLCAGIARELGATRDIAWFAVFGVMTMPAAVWMGSVVKNDFLMAGFQIASLLCVLRHQRQGRPSWLALGAFLLGASFAVKHSALFGAPALGLLLARGAWKSARKWKLGLVAGILIAAGFVWHARTYVLTGNPVYPVAISRAAAAVDASDPGSPVNNTARFAKILRDMHLNGPVVFENILPAPLGILPALFVPFAFLPVRGAEDRERRQVLFFVSVTFIYWIATMNNVRYLIAPLLLLPVLVAQPLARVWSEGSRATQVLVSAAILYAAATGALGAAIINNSPNQARLLAGRITRGEYLQAARPTYAPISAAGRAARPGDTVLSLGCCGADFYPESWNFHCVARLDEAGGWQGVGEPLAAGDYRFLIVSNAISQPPFEWPARDEIYRDAEYAVYRLTSRPSTR